MADSVEDLEVPVLPGELLGTLLLRGSHDLLRPHDVLAAGQRSDLTSSHLLPVDVHSLQQEGREGKEEELTVNNESNKCEEGTNP